TRCECRRRWPGRSGSHQRSSRRARWLSLLFVSSFTSPLVPAPRRPRSPPADARRPGGSDLFDPAEGLTGPPRQVDAELVAGSVVVLFGVPELDRAAVAGQHLDIQTE